MPHVRWRLHGRPYASIVTAGDTFDALAWVEDAARPEQVERLEVDGEVHLATALTLPRLTDLEEDRYGV